MSAVEDFLQNPMEDLLNTFTKEQLFKVADHFEVKVPSKALKDCILSTIKEHLVQLGVLPAAVEGSDAVSAPTPVLPAVFPQVSPPEQPLKLVRPVAGVGVSLTFDQQKELLTLQHKLEMERNKAQERDQALHAVELEKLRYTASFT
ncbi:uncharacterized protein LOC115247517 [Xyrichtys novacula]|uniref:Uncharacterized protein LOC115247517 n=1 Tax=Xyrichtys novacula TaxID=13765 RepID=A0AAV1GE48_XYRNO|nr:uncharacterized protein LOC115247517 [Xyrichtys novacula]